MPRWGAVRETRGSLRARPGPAWHLLSSRVLCSALSVRTFTFSEVLRGRRGVIRLTAAVLRKRLARPRVGELSQPGRGRGSAPPTARACMGRCGGEKRPGATQLPGTQAHFGLPIRGAGGVGPWEGSGWLGSRSGGPHLPLHLLQPSLHSGPQGPVSLRDSGAGGAPYHTHQFLPPPTARDPA